MTTDYNDICQLSNVAVITMPGDEGTAGGPTGAGNASPSATGFDSSPDFFSSAPFATPTGDVSGSDDSPSPATTFSLAGSPDPSPTGAGSSVGNGNTGPTNPGQGGGSQSGQGGKTSGGSRSKQPRKMRFIESILVAMSAVVFFG